MLQFVTEPTDIGAPENPAEIQANPNPRRDTLRQILASLLSAALPGAGHLWLGRRRKAFLLFALFLTLLLGFWPLRLLRFYAGFLALYGAWVLLGLCACCSAQLRTNQGSAGPSKWWLAVTLPVGLLIISLIGGVVTRASGFRSFSIPSTSMEPTIQRGDHIVVDARAFRSHHPQHQDVIVFYREGTFFLKRVIGVAGDTVEGRDGTVILNGHPLVEPYIQHSKPPEFASMYSFDPAKVPLGKYYVIGDNRDVSLDTRSPEFGFVDGDSILGKALYVFNTQREGATIQ